MTTKNCISPYHMQRPAPARIAEEVQRHVAHPGHGVANAGLFVLILRCFERPVIEQGPADDIRSGYKAPVARVQAVVPVIAHHEEHARRNYEIAILNEAGKLDSPSLGSSIGPR